MKCYCVKCKSKTDSSDLQLAMSKKNSPMIKSTCESCGGKKTMFISRAEYNKLHKE